MDIVKGITFGLNAVVTQVTGNSTKPGSLEGLAYQVTGHKLNDEHPRATIRAGLSSAMKIINAAPSDKKTEAIETAIKTVSDDFASEKIKIQVQKNGPLVNPDLVHSQKEAIGRSWRAIIEGRAELNQTLINSPNLVDAKIELKGHTRDTEIYFVEIRTADGKASVYLTHKENKAQKDSTVLAYLGNPPPRQAAQAAALPIQPLPPQLVNQTPQNPAPLVAANPGPLNPAPLAQPVVVATPNNPANLAATPAKLNVPVPVPAPDDDSQRTITLVLPPKPVASPSPVAFPPVGQ